MHIENVDSQKKSDHSSTSFTRILYEKSLKFQGKVIRKIFDTFRSKGRRRKGKRVQKP